MIDKEDELFSALEDPKFFQKMTEEVWKENFEKVGYIYIGVGDEPEGCTSRVYEDKHRYYSQSLQSIKIDQCHTRKDYPEVSITGTSRVGKIEILLVRRSFVEFRRNRRS